MEERGGSELAKLSLIGIMQEVSLMSSVGYLTMMLAGLAASPSALNSEHCDE